VPGPRLSVTPGLLWPTVCIYFFSMIRPVSETIESLRKTLAEIERDLDPDCSDPRSLRELQELRTIVLERITELETEAARERHAPREAA
jgi:hypothetical protein